MIPRYMRSRLACAALAVTWAALGGGATAGVDGPIGSRWIGPDALIYAESARPGDLVDRVTSDRVGRLLQASPGFTRAMARADVKFGRGVVDFLARGFGTTWDRGLRDLTGGGIVFAVEGTKGPEKIILVVTPKDRPLLEKVHARVLELARADAKTKGKPDPVAESDHAGTRVYSLAPTEAHAILDGALVVANGPEALRAVIDRARVGGASPGLADDPTFAARRNEADPEALAWGFARTDRLRAIDPKRFAGSKPDAGATFFLAPWLEAIRAGDWAAASVSWTGARLSADLIVAAPKGGYPPAMARYLPGKQKGAARPIAPPNAIASGSLWRDFEAIWEVRADLLPPETVQGLAQLDTQAGTFFGGRDFGTGVLGALGDHWSIVVADQDFPPGDPVPDVKLPGFAMVIELKPDDEEFAGRLMAAFQSFLGLVNLGSAQAKAPPLMIGSEQVDGLTIATSKYGPEIGKPKGSPVDNRYNFSPSAVRVGDRFVLSSSLGLARDLAKALKAPAEATTSVLLAEADGAALARLVAKNRDYLVTRNMLDKGNAKDQAEAEVGFLAEVLGYLGHASLRLDNGDSAFALRLSTSLDAK